MAEMQRPESAGSVRYSDGTDDLAFGVWLVAWSLGVWLSQGGISMWRWFVTLYGLIAVTWAVCHFGLRAIRAWLVYRRAGYVRLRRRLGSMMVLALIAAIVGSALSVYFARRAGGALSPPLVAGLLFGTVLLAVGFMRGAPKYAGYTVLSVGIGVGLQFAEPSMAAGGTLYFLLMGAAFLIYGMVSLYLFVRHTPVRDLEAE